MAWLQRRQIGRSRALPLVVLGLAGALVGACGDDASGTPGDEPTDTDGTGSTSMPEGSTGDDDGSSSGDETGGEIVCDEASVGAAPLRRLTRAQYANAVRDVLGLTADVSELEPDEKAGAFDSNFSAAVSPNSVEQYRALAERLAEDARSDFGSLAPCPDGNENACLSSVLDDVGRRLFRRPLTEDERGRYLDLANTGVDYDDSVQLLLTALLQSPNFLYHLELGLPGGDEPVVALSQWELASRLSFFLWNSVPDPALLDAAEAGELETAEQLREQAERLLGDSRARDAVGGFHVQWLGLDHIDSAFKDPGVYPDYDDELAEAMVDETRRFSQIVVLQGDGRLETLMTASFSYIDGPLFDLYDVEEPADHNPGVPVELDPEQRAGLITQAAFLTEHALTNQSGPIQRGVEIRAELLCDPPPPPPADANVEPPMPDPDSTTRELFEQHTADPTCASCHYLIDGIGLGMENYDGIGAFRTMENGKPVDASGSLVATDIDGEFNGGVELAHRLAQSNDLRRCVSRQWFRFALGRYESDADQCSLDSLYATFEQSDYDVRELLVQLVQTDAFRYRARD